MSQAYIYTVATILLWSTVATAFKIALRDLNPIQVLFWAAITSTMALTAALAAQGRLGTAARQIAAAPGRSVLLGLLNPFLYYIVLFQAYDLLPAQEAQPLNWVWPITLTLLSAVLLGQRVSIRTLFAVLLSFSGVLVISTRGDVLHLRFTNLLGDALAVGSSILWALYWIYNLKDSRDPVVKLCGAFLCGTIYIAVVMTVTASFEKPTMQGFLASIWIGLFEMGLTFVLWLRALSLAKDNATIGIFAYITPFLSLVFIYFVLGERILLSSVAGLGLIISGILLQSSGSLIQRSNVKRSVY